ncbi:hypothetical protein ABEB36_012305 [Hypothenemus hampei]|uniref:RING-type E3 ubiquitin transferase n=1 Tax=Hypothenemus hampei TaxID=57062 RepID=A0ABD1EBG1_HYPHA
MNGAIWKTTTHNGNENVIYQSNDIQVSNSPEISKDSNDDTSNSSEAVPNEKICSICLEDILQKPYTSEHTFGILPDCNHCFCFTCINDWRGNITNLRRMNRSCPVCRQKIEFIFPSSTWFESNEEKQLFISQEKTKMGQINCPYFQKKNSHCPFGSKCLYLHTLRPLAPGLSQSRYKRNFMPAYPQALHVPDPWTYNRQIARFRRSPNHSFNRSFNFDNDRYEIWSGDDPDSD